MHANQLAEIGSWVAVHSSNLVFGQAPQSLNQANEYWTASKCRLQRWITALKLFEHDIAEPSVGHDPWPAMETVVEEILLSEFLTRVWAASVLCHDQYHDSDELHGLAHSTFISHIEARNRAVRLLLASQSSNEQAFDRINLMRRKLERWTDLFMAQLPNLAIAQQFGFNTDRIADFYNERRQDAGPTVVRRQQVLMASFTADIDALSSYSANPVFNRQIASGILACFPSNRFDSTGLPKSARMLWVEKSQNDTQILVEKLADFETESLQKSARFIS
jgi:hypothetical protein